MRILFLGIILILAVNAFGQNTTPETVIKGFYAWYVPQISKNKFPLTDNIAKLKEFISTRYYKEVRNIYDKNEFDADYFISAQDFDDLWATNVKISKVKITGTGATANVILDGKGSFDSKLKLKLVKLNGVWKIDSVKGQNE